MDSFSHPTQRSGAIYKKVPTLSQKARKDGAPERASNDEQLQIPVAALLGMTSV
jgi:hypothetical protein